MSAPDAAAPGTVQDFPEREGAARADDARRSRLTALIVACALFMQNLDSTVVSTALPAMARSFGADPLHLNLALTAYLLSIAVFVPASGWIADRFGAKHVFRAAILVFTVGSVLCGRAETLPSLIAARILQGVGGALMVPVGRLVLLRTVAKADLVAAMAWLTVPSLIGPVVGPPLGGFITTYADWRWIFDINVPIGLLGIVLVTRYVDDVRDEPPGRFDTPGFVLSALALVGLLAGLETVGRHLVPLWATFALLLAGIAAAVGYVAHARRTPAPILDLGLMRIPTFAVSVWSGSLFRIGVGAVPFLLPLMLQLGFGRTAAESGLITFASSAGALAMKTVAQRALRQFGFRTTLVWNGALSAALLAATALFRPSWPEVAVYAVLLSGGFFRSLQFTAYNTLAYADVPRAGMSAATSLYATLQQVSLTLGVTVGAIILGASTVLSGHADPMTADFAVSFLGVGLCSLMAVPFALRLAPDAGAELTGHRPAAIEPDVRR